MGVVKDFLRSLESYLDERKIPSVEDIRGKTLPQLRSFESLERRDKGQVWVELDREACTKCNLCGNWCYHAAIEKAGTEEAFPRFIKENCEGCGLCAILCPAEAIQLKGKGPFILGDFS